MTLQEAFEVFLLNFLTQADHRWRESLRLLHNVQTPAEQTALLNALDTIEAQRQADRDAKKRAQISGETLSEDYSTVDGREVERLVDALFERAYGERLLPLMVAKGYTPLGDEPVHAGAQQSNGAPAGIVRIDPRKIEAKRGK